MASEYSYSLEQPAQTHYSGQDIHVFLYRNLSDQLERDATNQRDYNTSPFSPQDNPDYFMNDITTQGGTVYGKKKVAKGSYNPATDQAQPNGSKTVNKFSPKKRADYNSELDNKGGYDNVTGNGWYAPYTHIGTITELSYSSFREKFAVRTLGRTHAKTYTRGPRTVAGTIVFNTVQENEILKFAKQIDIDDNVSIETQSVLLDQIDPVHMILVFGNEYGSFSMMYLFNVEFSSESQRMSVNDLVIQQAVNFYATDVLPMEDAGNMFSSYDQMLSGRWNELPNKNANGTPRFNVMNKLDTFAGDGRLDELLQRSRGLF